MGILNRPSDGSAPVLLAIWKTLRALGPMSKEDLVNLCAPGDIDNSQVKKTIVRWTQISLFISSEDSIELSPPFNTIGLETGPDYRKFRAEVRKLALSEKSNDEFLKEEPAGTADFTLATAWLLSLDVYAGLTKDWNSINRIEGEHIKPAGPDGSKLIFQNNTRWDGFRDWATFLGFSLSNSNFSLDPTEAVHDELPGLFGNDTKLYIGSFLRGLSEQIPVLGEGSFSVRAKERAKEAWPKIQEHQITPAISRALQCLEVSGVIRLSDESDADSRRLLGPGMKEIRRCTHVKYEGAS